MCLKKILRIGVVTLMTITMVGVADDSTFVVHAAPFSSVQNKPARSTLLFASSVSYDTVRITWLAQDVDGYSIYRSSTPNEEDYELIDEVDANTVTYVDKGLEMETRYYYKVCAYRISEMGIRNTGDKSIALSVAPTLAIPNKVSAVSMDYSTIKLEWETVKGADGYILYRSEHDIGEYEEIEKLNNPDKHSYTVKDLPTGKKYDYRICAWKEYQGEEVYSGKSDILTFAAKLPKVEKVQSENITYNTVNLSWKAVKGADGYIVLRSTKKDGTYKKIKTLKDTSYTDEKLVTGKQYYYQIQAYRKVSGKNVLGKASEICSVKPMLDVIETADVESVDYQTISLNWEAIEGADGYIVCRALIPKEDEDEGISEGSSEDDFDAEDLESLDEETIERLKELTYEEVARVEETSYQDTELITGQKYAYQIQAYRVIQTQNKTEDTSSKKKSAKKKEKIVKAEIGEPIVANSQLPQTEITSIAKQGSDSIKLKFSAVEGADGYYIYRSTSADGTYIMVKDFTDLENLTYTDSGLSAETEYFYQIEAYRNIENYQKDADTDADTQDESAVVKGERSESASVKTAKIQYSGSAYKFDSETSNKIIQLAASKLGCPYVWGAAGPSTFDCSGLVVWVYRKAGCTQYIPHHAQSIYDKLPHISRENLQEGDLVFYGGSTSSITHVAIYAGGNKVIHAANPRSGVKVSAISSAGSGKIVGYAHISFNAK